MAGTLEKGGLGGLLATAALGAAAGFFSALTFYYGFGRNISFYFVSLKVPYIVNLANALAGGAAGFAWHFIADRFFR